MPLDHDDRVQALTDADDAVFRAAVVTYLHTADADPADRDVMHDWRIADRTFAALVELTAHPDPVSLGAAQMALLRARIKAERTLLAPVVKRYATQRAQAERLCAELHPGTVAAARALLREGLRPAEAKAELVRRRDEAGGQLAAPRQTRQRRGSGGSQ